MVECQCTVDLVLVDGESLEEPDSINLNTTPEAYDLVTIELDDTSFTVSIEELRNALNAVDAANGR